MSEIFKNKKKQLIKQALEAQKNAYAPYSKYKVGSAILTTDGTIFTGCNIENASYPCGLCAERTAISKAVSSGFKEFSDIAIAGSSDNFCTPCGICRQMLYEFSPQINVICCKNNGEHKEFSLKELLPQSFDANSL